MQPGLSDCSQDNPKTLRFVRFGIWNLKFEIRPGKFGFYRTKAHLQLPFRLPAYFPAAYLPTACRGRSKISTATVASNGMVAAMKNAG